jgi:hypothetical protein
VLVGEWQNQVTELEKETDLTPEEAGQLAETKALLAEVDRLRQQMVTDDGQIDEQGVLSAITTMIPPPYNIPVAIFGGGILEFFRSRKSRTSFKKLVEAMNKLKARNTVFKAELHGAKDELHADMGPTATATVKKLVDTGKLPLI